MYKRVAVGNLQSAFDGRSEYLAFAPPRQFDALVALERISSRRSFTHDDEIYSEGDASDCWYRVISGTVRTCKFMTDGRRHISEFCFPGDTFGFDTASERVLSAEAIGDVAVMRFPRGPTERLISENSLLARRICELTLRGLAQAHSRMLLLGRMTASERVASFLIELSERSDAPLAVDMPMTRTDIADYLGLTTETVCRVLTSLKRNGVIAIPSPHRIEICDRPALAAVGET